MKSRLHTFFIYAGILSALLCLSGCGVREAAPTAPAPAKPAATVPAQTEPAEPEPDAETLAKEAVEHLDIQVEAQGLWDLLDYPNLKSADLSGSTRSR